MQLFIPWSCPFAALHPAPPALQAAPSSAGEHDTSKELSRPKSCLDDDRAWHRLALLAIHPNSATAAHCGMHARTSTRNTASVPGSVSNRPPA